MRADRRDRSIAGTSAVAIHLLAIGLLFNQASNGFGNSRGNGRSRGDRLVVYPSLRVSPETRVQRIAATATVASIDASAAKPSTQAREQVLPTTNPDASRPVSQASPDSGTGAARRNAPQLATIQSQASQAASASVGSTGEDNLLSSYQIALRAAIFRTWKNLSPRVYPTGCTIHLTQNPGGMVTATSAAACGLAREEQLQLEAAALMAQPMPYVGYETVFSPEMDLVL